MNQILKNTPSKAIDPLLDYMEFVNVRKFLDPFRGEGGIYNSIPLNANQKESCGEKDPFEYFNFPFGKQFDLIIANPYCIFDRDKAITKSLEEAKTVCYLLPLDFLAGGFIRKLWWKKVGRPNKLLVLNNGAYLDNPMSYGWFCWDEGNYILYGNGIHVI